MAFFGQDDSRGNDHFTNESSVHKIFFVAESPSPIYKKVEQTLCFQLERSLHRKYSMCSTTASTLTTAYILAPTEIWGPGFYTEVWGPWVTRYIFK